MHDVLLLLRTPGVALLNGMPISAGADGCIRLWDVAAALPILALDTPRQGRLLGLEVQPHAGYIVTCGDGVHIFDAASAQLLHDLAAPQDLEEDGNGGRESFRCVAYSGSVLAAGAVGMLNCMCRDVVSRVHLLHKLMD